MVENIELSKIKGLDYNIQLPNKNYTHAFSLICQKQMIVPTLCLIGEDYYLLNFHQEVGIMQKYGVKDCNFLIINDLTLLDFKILRLTLSNIDLEFDPTVCSEMITDLTRKHLQKNLPSKLGIDIDLFNAYEVLLDFKWDFKSKKERVKIKDPNQGEIDWDNL